MSTAVTQPGAVQPAPVSSAPLSEQIWATYLLAAVAAMSDAVGYLVLQQLGASFMSGNTLVTGLALGRGDWTSALRHGLPIVSFVAGMLLGAGVLAQVRRWSIRPAFAVVFGLEGACILVLYAAGVRGLEHGVVLASRPGVFYLCTVVLTVAMGLQTATVTRVSAQGVRTTFFTGVLSDLAGHVGDYASWLRARWRSGGMRAAVRETAQQASFHRLTLLAGLWISYGVGAIGGSALEQRLSLAALLVPLGALAVLILVDIVRPFDQPLAPTAPARAITQ